MKEKVENTWIQMFLLFFLNLNSSAAMLQSKGLTTSSGCDLWQNGENLCPFTGSLRRGFSPNRYWKWICCTTKINNWNHEIGVPLLCKLWNKNISNKRCGKTTQDSVPGVKIYRFSNGSRPLPKHKKKTWWLPRGLLEHTIDVGFQRIVVFGTIDRLGI